MKVAVILGSESDLNIADGIKDALDKFDIKYEIFIVSVHRAPKIFRELIKKIEEDCSVIIAGAGLSAHLPGAVASQTDLPVIGIPIDKSLGGMDSLLSIVQMPKGVPVATVGIDNGFNAGLLAVRMLSIKNPDLKAKIRLYRAEIEKSYEIESKS